ncbi:hypothetical protein BP6252_06769 [Coleophoma cylindrospora]|uniref:Zn(2)-C6 fungal-type domain-containing protein n=1 Tax=Coleophoma cylindrospora TaxID=1849047 RepID=A0A3D8RFQ6_9HELO|nr:hypothetical protein BP6252_06769 [Coleophoma cylindrospora]
MSGKRRQNAAVTSLHLSGRTVGCLTCRRRRVKCNRATPVCGACCRLQLKCLSRPAADKYLWMPLNQVDIDSEPHQQHEGRTRDHDGTKTERTTQARRTALSTDEEREFMCQQLLQSTAQMDIDDILSSLRVSAEAGLGAVSSGPFTAFPVQAMDIAPIPHSSSPISPASLPNGPNSNPPCSSSFIDPLCISSGELLHPNDANISVDILNSVLEPGWQDFMLWSSGSGPLSLDFTEGQSSYALNTPEIQPESHIFQLPSPLSVHLPFLQPSQILERIPKDTFSLLGYYGSKILFFHSPFPSHKPPWKIMHHPSVLEITTALLVDAPVQHTQLALLYAILAISSFHMDWYESSDKQPKSGNSLDHINNTESYWWNIGKQFEQKAKVHLQLALRNEFAGSRKAKYKHILMVLCCMVTICVSTGEMDDARCFLLDAERVIRLRGLLKPQLSKKVRLLHNIFLYNRIIEESTFCYTSANQSEFSRARDPNSQTLLFTDDILDPVLLSCNSNGGGIERIRDREPPGIEISLSDQLIANDGVLFEAIYGVPMNLMRLISDTTSLAHDADKQHSSSSPADSQSIASFARSANTLEDLLCGFRCGPVEETHSREHNLAEQPDTSQTAGLRGQPSEHSKVMRYLVSAMHQALLIFFYRRIRKLNSYALQPFVKRTISDLFAFERAKEENNIVAPVICWPGFIAGAEALDEDDRRQFRQWFKQSGRGWRNFDAVGEVVEKFWKSKEQSSSRAGESTWEYFFRKHQVAIICT